MIPDLVARCQNKTGLPHFRWLWYAVRWWVRVLLLVAVKVQVSDFLHKNCLLLMVVILLPHAVLSTRWVAWVAGLQDRPELCGRQDLVYSGVQVYSAQCTACSIPSAAEWRQSGRDRRPEESCPSP